MLGKEDPLLLPLAFRVGRTKNMGNPNSAESKRSNSQRVRYISCKAEAAQGLLVVSRE